MNPTRYLAAVDGKDGTEHVVEVAADLARALGGRAELHLVHVVTGQAAAVPPALISYEAVLEQAREKLDAAVSIAGARYAGSIVAHLVPGDPADAILALAGEIGADLLVVGTADKKALERMIIGSVAEKVVRKAKCPVLVARQKGYPNEVTIEPPCPDCVEVQKKTNRVQLWCERHAAHHPKARLHSELPATFGVGSMLYRDT